MPFLEKNYTIVNSHHQFDSTKSNQSFWDNICEHSNFGSLTMGYGLELCTNSATHRLQHEYSFMETSLFLKERYPWQKLKTYTIQIPPTKDQSVIIIKAELRPRCSMPLSSIPLTFYQLSLTQKFYVVQNWHITSGGTATYQPQLPAALNIANAKE